MLYLGMALKMAPLFAFHQNAVRFLLENRRFHAENLYYQKSLKAQSQILRVEEGTYVTLKGFNTPREISYAEAEKEIATLNRQIKILENQSIYDAICDRIWPRKHWDETDVRG